MMKFLDVDVVAMDRDALARRRWQPLPFMSLEKSRTHLSIFSVSFTEKFVLYFPFTNIRSMNYSIVIYLVYRASFSYCCSFPFPFPTLCL